MRLIECYIENFGKISKQKYSFTDGLNCILDNNGSGKSTLAAFIKVMLYGMSDTKKTSLEENDRKHYLPWQGGACGGWLTFALGDNVYRVERSFGSKASDDTYAIYDTRTGKECERFADELGQNIFGIDADGFERTVFLSERALTPKSTNQTISAKLSDLVGCDGDIGGIDSALRALEDRRKFYLKKGGGGELSETKAKIDEVTRRLDRLEETEKALELSRKRMTELAEKMENAKAESLSLLKARETLAVRSAESGYKKKYAEISATLEGDLEKRGVIEEIFGQTPPTFSEIDEAGYKATEAKNLTLDADDSPSRAQLRVLSQLFEGRVEKGEIERVRSLIYSYASKNTEAEDPRIKRAKKLFAQRIPGQDEITDAEALLQAKSGSILPIILYAVFGICLAVGVVLPILIAIGAVGIIATLIFHLKAKSKRAKENKGKIKEFIFSVSGVTIEQNEEAKERLSDMKALLPLILSEKEKTEEERRIIKSLLSRFPEYSGDESTSVNKIIADYDKYTELLLAQRYKQSDAEERAQRAKRLQAEADEFLSRYKTISRDPFAELRGMLTEYNRLNAEIKAKEEEMARLKSLNAIGEDSQKQAEKEMEAIDRRRRENDELISSLSREYALTDRAYRSYADELDGRNDLLMRRLELMETLRSQKDNYDTILLTKKYITMAKDNMNAKYLGKTKSGFLKYAEIIGGISGEIFEMDTDFAVTKQEGTSTKPTEAYSRGTKDLFNLAARLALVDSLYEGEGPFIILDDPFVAFDDDKITAALNLLKQFATERQIIYFTCSKSRSI